ncbi:MAG: hypothetical protein ACFB50_18865 [Rubrobacteraceae bacterium]
MNTSRADELQDRVFGACMIAAPLLLLLSSVAYWTGGGPDSSTLGASIQVYAMFLFIPVVLGLSRLLWARAPRLAVAGRLLAIFGCVGGVGYGVARAFQAAAEQAGLGEAALAELARIYDFGLPLILNLPGVIFPLSMALLGVALWRTRAVPAWVGLLLALAGVGFPISRIPELQLLYYVADGLFIASLGWIGLRNFLSPAAAKTGTEVA